MRHFKKIASKSQFCSFFLIILLFSTFNAVAQDKVVVIPLFDDQQTNGPPAPVPRTGQTTSYATGDDGDLEKGVVWPNPRFTDNGNGTVKDNLTGLIWLRNGNCPGAAKQWTAALTFAKSLYDGWTGDGSGGDCGLSDGSSAGDWRLPSISELHSLIDYGIPTGGTILPSGNPFTEVSELLYWSATTFAGYTDYGWHMAMSDGRTSFEDKNFSHYVWPVRDGN